MVRRMNARAALGLSAVGLALGLALTPPPALADADYDPAPPPRKTECDLFHGLCDEEPVLTCLPCCEDGGWRSGPSYWSDDRWRGDYARDDYARDDYARDDYGREVYRREGWAHEPARHETWRRPRRVVDSHEPQYGHHSDWSRYDYAGQCSAYGCRRTYDDLPHIHVTAGHPPHDHERY